MTFVVTVAGMAFTAAGGGLLGGAAGALAGAALGGAEGAALGAGKAAISHEDVGKGALMGAATGAVGGALAPGVSEAGSAFGTAGGALAGAGAGALANTAGAVVGGKNLGNAALIGGITGGVLGGLNATPGSAPSTPGLPETPPSGVSLSQDQPGVMDALGSKLTNMSGTQALTNVGILGTGAMAESALNKKPEQAANITPKLAAGLPAAMAPTDIYKQGPISGIGSIGMARGGQVPVRDGAYIIPADVVSALGNGSSKAGAEFLRQLMEAVKVEATKRYGLGAAHRALA